MTEPEMKSGQTATGLRALAALCVVILAAWGLAGWWQTRKAQALRDLTARPEAALPDYDCPDQQRGNAPDRSPAVHSRSDRFNEITRDVGIDFQHVVGPLGTWFMPESIGAGAAVLDYDADGLMDLYFVNCGPTPETPEPFPPGTDYRNRLFRQTDSGTFVDVTEEAGLGDLGYGAGVAVGDVDNDGFPDVFIANYGEDVLYRNTGRGGFEQLSQALGRRDTEWGTAAAFVDYDRDGWLDLLVVNYTEDPMYGHKVSCGFSHGLVSYCGPHKFQPTVDRLYRNETGSAAAPEVPGPRSVRFRDVTEECGLTAAKTYGFGAICCDLTGDGWPDVFVANDGAPNRLWVNQRGVGFTEEAAARGAACNLRGHAEAGMGAAVGDVNSDAWPDMFVTHLTNETATLYLGNDSGQFTDQTPGSGLDVHTRRHTGWGTVLSDLDHDGMLDVAVVNGLVIPCHSGFPFHGEDEFQVRREVIRNSAEYWKAYADRNVLLRGREGLRFEDWSAVAGDFTAVPASGRSLASGDLDNDGDLDLVMTNCGGAAQVLRNDLQKPGSWLTLQLLTGAPGRDAIGAKVTLVCNGGRRRTAWCVPQSSYLASSDPRVHFGLAAGETVESIEVTWPDGPVESALEMFPAAAVNQFLQLRRGKGNAAGSQESVR
ncbi:MAG: CRTAC1 family protein [Planctomycetota bacterium]